MSAYNLLGPGDLMGGYDAWWGDRAGGNLTDRQAGRVSAGFPAETGNELRRYATRERDMLEVLAGFRRSRADRQLGHYGRTRDRVMAQPIGFLRLLTAEARVRSDIAERYMTEQHALVMAGINAINAALRAAA